MNASEFRARIAKRAPCSYVSRARVKTAGEAVGVGVRAFSLSRESLALDRRVLASGQLIDGECLSWPRIWARLRSVIAEGEVGQQLKQSTGETVAHVTGMVVQAVVCSMGQNSFLSVVQWKAMAASE